MNLEHNIKQVLDSITGPIASKRLEQLSKERKTLNSKIKSLSVKNSSLLLQTLSLQNKRSHEAQLHLQKLQETKSAQTELMSDCAKYKIENTKLKIDLDSIQTSHATWKKVFEKTELRVLEEKLSLSSQDVAYFKNQSNKLSQSLTKEKAESDHLIRNLQNQNSSLKDSVALNSAQLLEKNELISFLQKEKESLLKDLTDKASNYNTLATTKSEQEIQIQELKKLIAEERSKTASMSFKENEHIKQINNTFEKRLSVVMKENEELKQEISEITHKLSTSKTTLDKVNKTLRINNQSLLKLQTVEGELGSRILKLERDSKEKEEIIKSEKSRNKLLAGSLRECIEMGKRHREQILQLNERLKNKPLADNLGVEGSFLGRRGVNTSVLGTPSKLMFDSTLNK